MWFTLRFRDASPKAVIARHEVAWQSSQDRLTPRCHCEPVRAWQSSLLRCVGLPKRPLDCRVAPFGSPRNDNVKTGGFPTVPLDCRIGAFTLLAMTKWDGGRCGSLYGLGTPPPRLSLRDTKWRGNPAKIVSLHAVIASPLGRGNPVCCVVPDGPLAPYAQMNAR